MTGKNKSLCVVAGASGGHLIPALVVARNWKKSNPSGIVILWTSTKDLDRRVVHDYPFVDKIMPLGVKPFSLRPDKFVSCIFGIATSFFKAKFTFSKYRPEKLVSTGGILALPVAYAAYWSNVPVVLYELNAIPGKATKALAGLAKEINVVFKGASAYFKKLNPSFGEKCKVVNYPLKFEGDNVDFPKSRALGSINDKIEKNYKLEGKPLHFQLARKTIFVFGGSQGSESFNEFMRKLLKIRENKAEKIQVIHQIGSESEKRWQRQYQKESIPALVFSYTSNIEECYKVADLVFTRAGAGSLFEIAELKKKALIVPLESSNGVPIADSHQLFNACEMEKAHPELFTVFNQEAIEGNIRKIVSKMFELLKTDEKPKAVAMKPARRATKAKTSTAKSTKKSTTKTKTAKTKKTTTTRSRRA
jgi:UDP-N-acetylglucosamine--N-acetylmuramyl-(pentapeptide) pyrophosphoryl-undecaprenol N-acetylglucosamine transferase